MTRAGYSDFAAAGGGLAPSGFTADFLLPGWQPAARLDLRAARSRMKRLARTFARAYGTPDLGNLPDPLDEAVYILLTYQTNLDRARMVWGRLKSDFPTWRALLDAPAAELERVLQPSGFQCARASLIRKLLQAVQMRWGQLSLAGLERLSNTAAELELRALPGFDIKGARCVLMYSLQREVFPVDSNVFRFMQRYGVVAPSARYRRKATHDELQELVAPADRHSLHVNLVVHGQRTCLPQTPKCPACPVRRTCATGRAAMHDRLPPAARNGRKMARAAAEHVQLAHRD